MNDKQASPSVSACIPCLNHWESLPATVDSILHQTISVQEVLIIDDCSSHPCPHSELRENPRLRIIRLEENRGRGYCRLLATKETRGEFILTVDATNTLEEAFIEKALRHFSDPRVAAVTAALISKKKKCATDRWRARHLFHEDSLKDAKAEPGSMLITYGTLLKRSAIEKVGNFDASLRYKEDQEMGERLASAGFVVLGDPRIEVYPNVSNSVAQLLERYARWYLDPEEKPTLRGYLHNIKASFRPMMELDLREGDWPAAFISLLAPHFQLYHSIKANRKQRNAQRQHV